jgi:hypothetical protein
VVDGESVTRTVTSSLWGPEDRALMLAWREYQDSLCRCGEPRAVAWHPHNNGEYAVAEDDMAECHACTALEKALNPDAKPVRYPRLTYLRDETTKPLPPWPRKRSA